MTLSSSNNMDQAYKYDDFRTEQTFDEEKNHYTVSIPEGVHAALEGYVLIYENLT